MSVKEVVVRIPGKDWDLISSVAELRKEKVEDIALEGLKHMIVAYLCDPLDDDPDKETIGDILECDMYGPYDFEHYRKTKGKCKCVFVDD